MKNKSIVFILLMMIFLVDSQNFQESSYNLPNLNLIEKDNNELNVIPNGFFISIDENSSNKCLQYDYYQGSVKIATFTSIKVEFFNVAKKTGCNELILEFLNKNIYSIPIAENLTPTLFHFFLTEDANKAITNVKTYSSIIYRNIWSNIDLIYYGTNQGIKYKIVIQKEADLQDICIKIKTNNNENNLNMKNSLEKIIDLEPKFQSYNYKTAEDYHLIPILTMNNILKFEAKNFDLNEFTIDSFVFSTYVNSNSDDGISSVVTDENGYIYVGGYTNGLNFPTHNPFDDTHNGNDDIFIMKFLPDGSSLVYSTFLGSSHSERVLDLTLDKFSNLIGTGYITGNGLPTTIGCYDSSFNGNFDCFVFKLNTSGSGLDYCTYFGTDEYDVGKSVRVSSTGYIYLFGITKSANLPTTINSFDDTYNGGFDAFLVKINPNNTIIDYCTYIGGSLNESGNMDMNINELGILYCCGSTDSADFPTLTNSIDSTFNGGKSDGYIFLFNTTNDVLYYSTFFGGSYEDTSQGITLDKQGNIYFTGSTYSSDLPTTLGSYDTTYNINKDIFVVKLTRNGSNMLWSTFLGGTNIDESLAIAIDNQNNVYLTGMTYSNNFPITNSIFSQEYSGQKDGFITVLSSDGSQILSSTYIGGSSDDYGTSIAVDSNGFAIIGGLTQSSDFYTSNSAFEESYRVGGLFGWDAFLMKIDASVVSIELKDLLNNSDVIENTKINLNITYADTIIYNWDNGLNQSMEIPYQTYTSESPGMHILSIYANDSSDNWLVVRFVFFVNPDIDQDNLTNIQEEIYGTDPFNSDSDSDGLTDGDEVIIYNTDPLSIDTDQDGFSDYIEITNGYDPLDPEDHPPLTRLPTTIYIAPEIGLGLKIVLIMMLVSLATIIVLFTIYFIRKKD